MSTLIQLDASLRQFWRMLDLRTKLRKTIKEEINAETTIYIYIQYIIYLWFNEGHCISDYVMLNGRMMMMNNELEMLWKSSQSYLRYYPRIFHDGLRKITKILGWYSHCSS